MNETLIPHIANLPDGDAATKFRAWYDRLVRDPQVGMALQMATQLAGDESSGILSIIARAETADADEVTATVRQLVVELSALLPPTERIEDVTGHQWLRIHEAG